MTTRPDRLLREIEAGALDSETPIGDVLRKAVALGGESASADLRDWAARELRGYRAEDELPAYRTIRAPLQIDLMNMQYIKKGETISPLQLPDDVHGKITNDVPLVHGIAEIDQLARRAERDDVVRIAPPGSAELVAIMNMQGNQNALVERLYWGISPASLYGVIDQVRTALTVLVAEIRATMPKEAETPSADITSNALAFAVTGKRHTINVAAPQSGSTVTTSATAPDTMHWIRIAGAIIIGLVGIAAAVFGLMQVQDWSF